MVDYKRSRVSRSTSNPVVRFVTDTGESVEFASWVGAGSNPYFGEEVKVLYDPKNPQHAEIDSFQTLWLGLVFLGGLGALSIYIGWRIAAAAGSRPDSPG